MQKPLLAVAVTLLLASLSAPLVAATATETEIKVIKLAVLAVEFSDVRHSRSTEEIERLFFGPEGSLAAYYT